MPDEPLTFAPFPDHQLLDRWLRALSLPDQPVLRNNVWELVRFWAFHMPDLPMDRALAIASCLELTEPVRVARLRPGDVLMGQRYLDLDPSVLFFQQLGHFPHGFSPDIHGQVRPVFRVLSAAPALQGSARSDIDRGSSLAAGCGVSLNRQANRLEKRPFSLISAELEHLLLLPHAQSYLHRLNG